VVANTGNVTLTDIDVVDDLTGDAWTIATLAPGESVTFTATYTITQADMDAGIVTNTVMAAGEDPVGNTVEDDDTAIILASQNPELEITKSVEPQPQVFPDEMVTYTIEIENTGNVLLTNLLVSDQVPNYTTFLSADQGGVYNDDTNTVTWYIDQIEVGELVILQMYVLVDDDASHNTVIENVAYVESDQTDEEESNVVEVIVMVDDVDCDVLVQGAITPDGDGINDVLRITGLDCYPNNTLQIFNRWGTLVYEASPYRNDWDGVPNRGRVVTEADGRLPAGTYYYVLEFEPGEKPLSGYIYLIK